MKVRFLHDSCLSNKLFKGGDIVNNIADEKVEQLIKRGIIEEVKEVKEKATRKRKK